MRRLALLLIILLAFAFRLSHLDGQSLWSDEGLTLYRVGQPLTAILENQIVVDGVPTTDTNPALYFLLLHFWRAVAGESVFILRFAGVLLALLGIPLLYGLGRLLSGPRLGLAAALFLAISPFHIWQTQELRNYGLLVTVNLLGVYGLARYLFGDRQWRWLALWLLASLLGIYTHYFGFLVAAFGAASLAAALLLQPRKVSLLRRRWFWLLGAGSFLLLVPALLLALERFNAGQQIDFYRMPVRTIAEHAVHAFAVGVSRTPSHPWWAWSPGVALALLGVVAAARGRRGALPFLLAYLLIPLGLLLALSIVNPLYNGVRHLLIALPPFLLLAGWGAVGLTGFWRRGAFSLAAVVAVIQIVWLWTQFHTTPLIRDDIRGAAHYIAERAQSGDVVVLHDTLISFAFEHYYTGSAPVFAAPLYGQMEREPAIARLREVTAGAGRVWFLTEPTPRTGFPRRLLLDWAGENWLEVDARAFPSMWLPVQVGVFLPDPTLQTLPATATAREAHWPGVLRLHGYDLPPRLASGEEWWPLFFLEQDGAETKQYSLSLRLEAGGQNWGQIERVLGGASSPPASWPENTLISLPVPFTLPAGLPPGAYQLSLRLVETETGRLLPLGDGATELSLGEMVIDGAGCDASPATWPVPAVAPAGFGSAHELVGLALPDNDYRPGHLLVADLLWCVHAGSTEDFHVQLQLVGDGGKLLAESREPFGKAAGPADQLILHHARLPIPAAAEPGEYRVRVGLLRVADARPLWTFQPWPRQTFQVGTVTVIPWPLETNLPVIEQPVRATLGEPPQIEFHGFNMEQRAWSPGAAVPLTFVWRASTNLDATYHVLVHLENENGEIVAYGDGSPTQGFRPTSSWRKGEVIVDERTLALPADLPPGDYTIWTGLYNPDDGQRLGAYQDGARLTDDRIRLGELAVGTADE